MAQSPMSKPQRAAQRPLSRKHPAPAPNSTEAINLGPLVDFIGFNLRLAQDASFRAYAGTTAQARNRPGRFAMLMVIRLNPGISQSAVSRAIARDKSTVSPLIKELQAEGLITRTASSRDRRSFILALTPKGESVLDDLLIHAREHDRRLDAIAGDVKPDFIKLLKRIANSLG